MADWGPFVQGLAGTLPQVGFQTYAIRQRDEALARQEKQLNEQIKKQEINEAQHSLYKGLEWSEKLSDDVKPQIIDSMIVPAMETLKKHNVMSYSNEQMREFATKLKGNVTVGSQFMKDFKNIIDLNTDKKSGSVNYKEILKGIDMLLPTYGKKLTENEIKIAEVQKQNVARQGVTDPNTSAEDKKLLGSYLPTNAQKALGIGIEDDQKINDFNVFYRGYKSEHPDATEADISRAWHSQKVAESKVAANIRVQAFGTTTTPTPGVYFDKVNQKPFKIDENGQKQYISSEEAKKLNLTFKEETPTNDIKVMKQSVPSVVGLVKQSRKSIDAIEKRLGPAASRFSEYYSGKIGASDPDFRKLKADVNLLVTRLMKMHVGARGGEYIMKHFEEIINAGKDSPANMRAALDEIERYALEIADEPINMPKKGAEGSNLTIVETRKTKDGRVMHKMSDGSITYGK